MLVRLEVEVEAECEVAPLGVPTLALTLAPALVLLVRLMAITAHLSQSPAEGHLGLGQASHRQREQRKQPISRRRKKEEC